MVEVTALAGRRWPMALACSAWLMGWDPGAQVVGTAAGQGLPFLVISAGTRHQLAQLPVVAGDVRPRATAPTGSAEDHGGSSPGVKTVGPAGRFLPSLGFRPGLSLRSRSVLVCLPA